MLQMLATCMAGGSQYTTPVDGPASKKTSFPVTAHKEHTPPGALHEINIMPMLHHAENYKKSAENYKKSAEYLKPIDVRWAPTGLTVPVLFYNASNDKDGSSVVGVMALFDEGVYSFIYI